jgi:hypothetical protein
MALTKAQAKDLRESLADVFTPEGDAGVIDLLHTFATPTGRLYGKGQCARVVGANVREWYPIADLDSAETLRG